MLNVWREIECVVATVIISISQSEKQDEKLLQRKISEENDITKGMAGPTQSTLSFHKIRRYCFVEG